MARSRVKSGTSAASAARTGNDDWEFPGTSDGDAESSLLELVDNVLNHGVVLHGELILGVANVDLIYAKLSVVLAALDKLHAHPSLAPRKRPPHR